MLAYALHPQLVDNLAMGLIARFNIKEEPKDVVRFINKFKIPLDEEEEFISSGFPIGKVQSRDHLNEIKKEFKGGSYYNITTGKTMKAGNPSFYYGEGWCVKRNTPAHIAMVKADAEKSEDEEEIEIDVDRFENWEVIKNTKYIWSRQLGKIVGKLKDGQPAQLTQKAVVNIKKTGIPWQRLSEEAILKYKLE